MCIENCAFCAWSMNIWQKFARHCWNRGMYDKKGFNSLINWQFIQSRPNYDASGRLIKDARKEGEATTAEEQKKGPSLGELPTRVPCGLVVRIRRSHRRGRGSIPRMGDPASFFFSFSVPLILFFRVKVPFFSSFSHSLLRNIHTVHTSYILYWQIAQGMKQEVKRRREMHLQSHRVGRMKSSHPLLLKSCNSWMRFSAGHRSSELFNHLRYVAFSK